MVIYVSVTVKLSFAPCAANYRNCWSIVPTVKLEQIAYYKYLQAANWFKL